MRFPGFTDEWEVKKLREIASNKSGKYNPAKSKDYIKCIELEHLNSETGQLLGYIDGSKSGSIKNEFKKGDILYGKLRPYLKKYFHASFNGVCSSEIWVLKSINISSEFLYQIVQTNSFNDLTNQSSGSKMPRADWSIVENGLFHIPTLLEQNKIADFLSLLDDRINTQRKTIRELKVLKIQTRNKLFSKIIKDNSETTFVEDILNYEQPTKYIVSSTEYLSDKSLIPVLTANKAFVLGYTDENFGIYDKSECIILDDFTMDLKFVDFPFKVKSSAIKILTAKENINLKFIFEYFSFLNFSSSEHKRHYISEIEQMSIVLPSIEIQTKIAVFLSKIDEKLNLEIEILNLYSQQKKYLLSNLFI